jgi:hypothetical protein
MKGDKPAAEELLAPQIMKMSNLQSQAGQLNVVSRNNAAQ